MTALSEPRHRYTYEEYLAFERDTPTKHEFFDGEIYAMAGGTRRHNALAFRIGTALGNALPPGCEGFQSDQKVRVLATGRVTYPDVTVVCGALEGDPADPDRTVVTNPTILVEVLSRSTEEVDRSSKWRDYQLIPSLAEYVLVSQAQPRIEVYRRQRSGTWEYVDVRAGAVKLGIGATLDLSELYRDLPEE